MGSGTREILKVDDNMKIHIKEQVRKTTYSETTNLKTLSQSVKTKGAPKKVISTPSGNSTMWSPSYFKHVDKLFLNSSTSKSQKVFLKELALENHLFHDFYQKSNSSTRNQF